MYKKPLNLLKIMQSFFNILTFYKKGQLCFFIQGHIWIEREKLHSPISFLHGDMVLQQSGIASKRVIRHIYPELQLVIRLKKLFCVVRYCNFDTIRQGILDYIFATHFQNVERKIKTRRAQKSQKTINFNLYLTFCVFTDLTIPD